jgi:hypothetical protein
MSTVSTKIRIAFATNGPGAVIMREGPIKQTRMLAWRTDNDSLTEGQWINSSVPHFTVNSDASLVLAFVQGVRDGGPWVAVSRPPWFTALGVWWIGDSWGGYGSHFITDRRIYIAPGLTAVEFKGRLGKSMEWTADPRYRTPESALVSRRLPNWELESFEGRQTWLKRSTVSGLEVRRRPRGQNFTMEVFAMNERTLTLIDTFDDVYFADFDSRGEFVYTRRDGKVHRAALRGTRLVSHEIFDLSSMSPEPIVAPLGKASW